MRATENLLRRSAYRTLNVQTWMFHDDFPPGFEWDGVKREINFKEHRIDFRDAPSIFDGPHLIWRSSRKGEHRLLAIGLLEEKEVAVVFTIRNGIKRIISIRRARTYERQAFQDALPRLGSSP